MRSRSCNGSYCCGSASDTVMCNTFQCPGKSSSLHKNQFYIYEYIIPNIFKTVRGPLDSVHSVSKIESYF